jgi:hypothetical protein
MPWMLYPINITIMVGTGDLGQYFSTSGSHITAYPWINLYQYTNSGYI